MKQITKENYKTVPIEDVLNGIGVAVNIADKTIPFLIDLINHWSVAFQNLPRVKRLRKLEEWQKVQTNVNSEILGILQKQEEDIKAIKKVLQISEDAL